MPISLGTTTVTALYLGTTSITSAYLGNTQVFGGSFTPLSLFSGGAQGIWLDPSDLSTMFSDRAGTTPVTTPGTVVGLRLDKSKGLVLGAELVTNGDFAAGSTGWTLQGTATISGGVAVINSSSSTDRLITAGNVLPAGKFAKVEFDLVVISGGITLQDTLGGNTVAFTTSGRKSLIAFSASAAGIQFFRNVTAGSFNGTIDNISVRELAGNHAVAPTDAARPIYGVEPKGGRRNLLTWSEDFRNTAAAGETRPWTYTSTAVTPNADGVAELVYPLTSGTTRGIERLIGAVSSAAHATSIEAKASGLTWLYLYGGQGNSLAYFNLSTGAVGTVGSGLTAAITGPDAGGYYRCSVTQTCTSLSFYAGGCDANGSTQATASGTNGVLIRNAQLELGSTATAYQRVTTAYDVTESGVATCHYIQYDGSDDSMSTSAIDFTATDKMSVFAGVRKLSDAALGTLAELSANANSNNGAFNFFVPAGANTKVSWTVQNAGYNGAEYTDSAAPLSMVLSVSHDIAAAGASEVAFIRKNGVAQTLTSTSSTNLSGNFGNYPLFIGRRGNATLPFSGKDYGIVIVGKAASATEITDTETWLAAKTSGVTL